MKENLRIAILNLMPTKKETENQLTSLLKSKTSDIDLQFLYPGTHYQKREIPVELKENYKTYDEINLALLDGFIITGAPVERLAFTEVNYWEELTEILDALKTHNIPRFFICWGAQAALYHYYQINKLDLEAKCVGIFPHELLTESHPLFNSGQALFSAPHSRYTTSDLEQLSNEPALEVVAYSKEAGAYLVSSRDYQETFVFGHAEYGNRTLQKEYERDVLKESLVPLPKHYFPQDNPENEPLFTWSSHRKELFSNWIKLIENAKVATPI